jgi:hypothetical protein
MPNIKHKSHQLGPEFPNPKAKRQKAEAIRPAVEGDCMQHRSGWW